MEKQFLKKQSRAHKYLANLTREEIDTIIDRHVPRLKAIQILNLKSWPEVRDEYLEKRTIIVDHLKADLQKEFLRKIRVPKPVSYTHLTLPTIYSV